MIMVHKKLQQQHIESIKPGIFMLLDETYPVVVAKSFMKNWFVTTNIEVTYHWVEILHEDKVITVKLERLTHMEA